MTSSSFFCNASTCFWSLRCGEDSLCACNEGAVTDVDIWGGAFVLRFGIEKGVWDIEEGPVWASEWKREETLRAVGRGAAPL